MSMSEFVYKITDRTGRKLLFICLLLNGLLFVWVVSGCNGTINYTTYTQPQFSMSGVRKIVVLPFDNYTSDRYAAAKVRKDVIIDLMSRGIEIIEPGEVSKILSELKMRSVRNITMKNLKYIEKQLKVNIFLKGSVGAYQISKGISVTYPEVSVYMKLVSTKERRVVWSVSHTSGGSSFWTRHFGAEGLTLDETSRKIVSEAVDTLF